MQTSSSKGRAEKRRSMNINDLQIFLIELDFDNETKIKFSSDRFDELIRYAGG